MKINQYKQFVIQKNKIEYLEKLEHFNESLINEKSSVKDVLIGLSILAGVLTGNINKAQAQSKLSDKNIIQKIDNVLNDKEQLQIAIDSLESRGMEDVADIIKKNANDAKKEIKKIFKTYRTSTVDDYDSLIEKLNKGYAISSITTKKAIQTIEKDSIYDEQVFTVDTLEINWSNDELFGIGVYELDSKFRDSIVSVFQQLKDNNLSILTINIESSTDKQRIGKLATKLKSDGYEESNKGLSQARNDAVYKTVKSILNESNSEIPIINQKILYEQGRGEENATTEQDPSARYVKIELICVHISDEIIAPKKVTIIEEKDLLIQSFKLVRAKKIEIKVPSVRLGFKSKRKGTDKKNYGKTNCSKMTK